MSAELMNATHDARSIAKLLVKLGIENSTPRSPLQIIKLTYLCHGWMLGLYGRALSAQPVEAWQYGPVIPDVYHGLKHFGGRTISSSLKSFQEGNFDEIEDDLITQVSDAYGEFTGIQLSQLTHAIGTPWHTVWNKYGRNTIIPNPLIQEHFSQLAESDE